jgi:hypothetical protein
MRGNGYKQTPELKQEIMVSVLNHDDYFKDHHPSKDARRKIKQHQKMAG